MTASTDEPTRPITERVIATLPGCPEWCDQKHRNLEYDGGLTHEKWIGGIEVPGEIIGQTDRVVVSITAHESISGLEVLRGAPEVQMVHGDTAFRTDPDTARLLGLFLQDAVEVLEQVEL